MSYLKNETNFNNYIFNLIKDHKFIYDGDFNSNKICFVPEEKEEVRECVNVIKELLQSKTCRNGLIIEILGANINVEHFKILVDGFTSEFCPEQFTLALLESNLGTENIKELAKVIKGGRYKKGFTINFGDKGIIEYKAIESLVDGIQPNPENPSFLEDLSLDFSNGCFLDKKGIELLSKGISMKKNGLKRFSLNLGGNPGLFEDKKDIIPLLGKSLIHTHADSTEYLTISLSGNCILDDDFALLFNTMINQQNKTQSLKGLSVGFMSNKLTSKCLKSLSQFVFSEHCPKDFSIDFDANSLGNNGVEKLIQIIVKKNCPIKKLGLSWNDITDTGLELLANVLHESSIKELDLSKNKFSKPAIDSFLKMLTAYNLTIEQLNIDDLDEKQQKILDSVLLRNRKGALISNSIFKFVGEFDTNFIYNDQNRVNL